MAPVGRGRGSGHAGPPQLALKLSPSICSPAENKNAVLELKSSFTFSEMWFKHF